MNKIWKKRLFIVCLAVFLTAAILVYELFQLDPVILELEFVFTFFAFITLFPLIITGERPRLSRYIYLFNLRAPPLN